MDDPRIQKSGLGMVLYFLVSAFSIIPGEGLLPAATPSSESPQEKIPSQESDVDRDLNKMQGDAGKLKGREVPKGSDQSAEDDVDRHLKIMSGAAKKVMLSTAVAENMPGNSRLIQAGLLIGESLPICQEVLIASKSPHLDKETIQSALDKTKVAQEKLRTARILLEELVQSDTDHSVNHRLKRTESLSKMIESVSQRLKEQLGE